MSEEATTVAENPNEATPPAEPAQETPKQAEPSAAAPKTLLGTAAETKETPQEPAEATEKPAEKPAEGAPEKYDEFKAPEGVQLDQGVMETFSEVAKGLNLPQEKAQEVIDKMGPIMAKRQMEQVQAINQQWTERSLKNPEIANHMADVARVRDMFGKNADGQYDPDIMEFMSSPAGNHPGVLKLLARAGARMGEGGFPKGSPVARQLTPDDVYRKN